MNPLCINFSNILSILDRREIDLSLQNFLWIGITFGTFSFSGNIAVENDVLKMIERFLDISSVTSLRILVGMLFGPDNFVGQSIRSQLFLLLHKLR